MAINNFQIDIEIDSFPASIILSRGMSRNDGYIATSGRHIHPFYEIHLFISGSYIIQSNMGELAVGRGDIAIIPPKTDHYIGRSNDEGPHKHASFWIRIDRWDHKPEKSYILGTFSQISTITRITGVDFIKAKHSIDSEINAKRPLYIQFVTNEITNLLILICRKLKENDACVQPETHCQNNIMASIEEYIDDHIRDGCSIEKLSEKLHISQRQLTRLTRSWYSKSFKRLLFERRMSAACLLLQESDMPLTEISQNVGYSSPTSFHHAYMNFYGITPAKHRNKTRPMG